MWKKLKKKKKKEAMLDEPSIHVKKKEKQKQTEKW